MPKAPKPQSIPERQAAKAPDKGADTILMDDDARRKRALRMSVFSGAGTGGGGAVATTNKFGA